MESLSPHCDPRNKLVKQKKVLRYHQYVVKADKTTNSCRMKKTEYQNLIKENVDKLYKKTTDNKPKRIIKETRNIARTVEIDDNMEK